MCVLLDVVARVDTDDMRVVLLVLKIALGQYQALQPPNTRALGS